MRTFHYCLDNLLILGRRTENLGKTMHFRFTLVISIVVVFALVGSVLFIAPKARATADHPPVQETTHLGTFQ